MQDIWVRLLHQLQLHTADGAGVAHVFQHLVRSDFVEGLGRFRTASLFVALQVLMARAKLGLEVVVRANRIQNLSDVRQSPVGSRSKYGITF